jgi:hypothetical protein
MFGFQLAKALPQNTVRDSWLSPGVSAIPPSGDGVIAAGSQNTVTMGMLKVLPYCEGGVGSTFSMRVYGWEVFPNPNNVNNSTWIPTLLVEVACTAGTLLNGAIPGGPVQSYLADSETLCDTITLTQGYLGYNGAIRSFPGIPGVVRFEMPGCQYYQFDFQLGDTGNQIGMNAFWGRS